MASIPHENALDSVRGVLADPYRFVSGRCARLGIDLFQTRLVKFRAVCMTGTEAAETFYDSGKIQRAGAAPRRLLETIFGQAGVQTLDGARHAARKQLFTSLLDTDRVATLAASFASAWRERASSWAGKDEVVLYDELRELLTRTVCDWAGVPLPEHHVHRRTEELTALFDGAGAVGLRHWRGRRARTSTQRWIEDLIGSIRTTELRQPEGSVAHTVAWHMDPEHGLLPRQVAATELLNILRPTVAVAVYIAHVAHAMHEHPHWARRLQAGEGAGVDMFVQEVRRSYPFFPAVVGMASEHIDWHGYRIPAGSHVLLDLYGTNHDPRTWQEPDRFDPDRFRTGDTSKFDFIPQGGGDPPKHHRCPGEPITTELMKAAVGILSDELDYELPEQDLRIDYSRLPALPRSGIRLRNVRSYV